MENCVVLEGVAETLSAESLASEVFNLLGRVTRVQRIPGCDGAVMLQFGLENTALLALGSLCADLYASLPSDSWEQAAACISCPPQLRPPTEDEYNLLTKAWRDEIQEERLQRFIADGGTGTIEHYFDLNFDFKDIDSFQETAESRVERRSAFSIDLRVWMDNCGTGATLWTCGLLLGECLWHGLVPVGGKRVLELGCGCAALPSVVAIHLGAASVVATDLVTEVLDTAAQNTRQHGVEVQRLDWSDYVNMSDDGSDQAEVACVEKHVDVAVEKADVVLWSDAVYTEFGGFLLAHAVQANIQFGGLIAAVIPEEDRPGMDLFESKMNAYGYVRSFDERVPLHVAEKANQRFGLTRGTVSVSKGNPAHSRLVLWSADDLYG